jgi:hypothetical protein
VDVSKWADNFRQIITQRILPEPYIHIFIIDPTIASGIGLFWLQINVGYLANLGVIIPFYYTGRS